MPTTEPTKPWGKSLALDLHECDLAKLTDPEGLKVFIQDLIKVVNMEAHGPCYVDRFGEGEIEGYSAMQFIKTSAITVHLDEVGKRAFIDIFSCKDFDADKAADFAKEYFQAHQIQTTILAR
jgi:S-adenosylmethionine/arginine decarboxylase-like enzyme